MTCRVPVQYVKRNEPHSIYQDSCSLHSEGDFNQTGSNTWVGHYKNQTITVFQQHRQSDIKETDITISQNPGTIPDPDLSVYFPTEKIAEALNKYLNKIFS